jgi:hypothetical protein
MGEKKKIFYKWIRKGEHIFEKLLSYQLRAAKHSA